MYICLTSITNLPGSNVTHIGLEQSVNPRRIDRFHKAVQSISIRVSAHNIVIGSIIDLQYIFKELRSAADP